MSINLKTLRRWALGAPLDPLNPRVEQHIALIAFLAWVGLGADGLSSSCYGPEEAFLALGSHAHLALYLAIATAATVFIISLAYNQVIELFPTGGGGYRVATDLIGPYAGLISGSALIVDYVLTITISIASGVDALFSLLPLGMQLHKLQMEAGLILLLIWLNLRGVRESIWVLMPIFLGFVIIHATLIIYGVGVKATLLPVIIQDTVHETFHLSQMAGWFFVLSLFLRAYSLGGGTYTGIEAVSNNVGRLKQPRVRTGKWTMFYMAVSLSFTAGGFIFLYLLWHVKPTPGETLNASTFRIILQNLHLGTVSLWIVLVLEASLLFVASNTGFLGGPAVLANMALDSWVPNRFRHLSSRLVTQNGVVVFGVAALLILFATSGRVSLLVVLYSINVFLTFSLALFGLCIYWITHHRTAAHWRRRLVLSIIGFVVCSAILVTTLYSKFTSGGWMTVVVTSFVVCICLLIHRHYALVSKQLRTIDAVFSTIPVHDIKSPPALDPEVPTAVFFVGKNRGTTMHTLLWAQRMFPQHFKNFIFISVGVVDVESFGGKNTLTTMKREVEDNLQYFVSFCHHHHYAADAYCEYGTDPVSLLTDLAEKVYLKFPKSIFFSSKLVFENDNWVRRLLHNETPLALQRRLHLKGMQMVVLPMKV